MNFELGFVGVFVYRGLETLQIQRPLTDLSSLPPPPPPPPFKLTFEGERERFLFSFCRRRSSGKRQDADRRLLQYVVQFKRMAKQIKSKGMWAFVKNEKLTLVAAQFQKSIVGFLSVKKTRLLLLEYV